MSQAAENSPSTADSTTPIMKRKRVHPIWSKFEKLSKNDVSYLRCITCKKDYKLENVTVTTLKYHWETKHPDDKVWSSSDVTSKGHVILSRTERMNHAFSSVLAIPNMVAAFTDLLKLPNEFEDPLEDDSDDDDYCYGFANFSEAPDESILLSTFPQRIACYAHSLQLVLMDLFKESIFGTEDFKAMCKVMRQFKHSQQAKEPFQEIVSVIQVFLDLKDFMRPIAEKKGWALPTEDQIEYLRRKGAGCRAGDSLDTIKYWCNYLSSDWHSMAVLALEVLTVPPLVLPLKEYSHRLVWLLVETEIGQILICLILNLLYIVTMVFIKFVT
uniref:BED-type domain-containing protein n=1 Tax=Ditylenchus dipsaci TaxID=166011 RepID=A0A915DV63_9BILA